MSTIMTPQTPLPERISFPMNSRAKNSTNRTSADSNAKSKNASIGGIREESENCSKINHIDKKIDNKIFCDIIPPGGWVITGERDVQKS